MLNKKTTREKFYNKSFTLLEVIIAIFIVTIGITGVMSLIHQTIILTSVSSNRLIAAYLGQEGIEIVRSIRDTNWLNRINWDDGLAPGNYEVDYYMYYLWTYDDIFLNWEFYYNAYGYYPGIPTIFKRKIIIQRPQAHILEITVEVNWQERGKPYSFSVKEHLYRWH